MPYISVIIPTYCRKVDLLRTLICINKQIYRNFEVIIVDASPFNLQLSNDEIYQFDFRIKYERYGIAGNVSKQRNIGLNQADGEIILFLDDDVTFDFYLFSNYYKLFQDETVNAISGLVETSKYQRSIHPIKNKGLKIGDIGHLNHQPCDFITETNVICTANFGFRKELYNIFGGFDEFLFGSLDDVDYGFKLITNGVIIIHHPAVSVFHHQTALSGARSNCLPEWWSYYNLWYFQMKHRNEKVKITFIITILQFIRPSRFWLSPLRIFKNIRKLYLGYSLALKAINLYKKVN